MASSSHQCRRFSSSPTVSSSLSPTHKILQLKITLRGITPKIWRRLLVSSNDTFEDLHHYIQAAMGWGSCHIHRFLASSGTLIISEEEEDIEFDFPILKETITRLERFLKEPKDKVRYIYDFVDDWMHDVVVEKVLPFDERATYPRCIAGKMACPPEDCGGAGEYLRLLDVWSNPNHPDYENLINNWLNDVHPDFDPKRFELAQFFF